MLTATDGLRSLRLGPSVMMGAVGQENAVPRQRVHELERSACGPGQVVDESR